MRSAPRSQSISHAAATSSACPACVSAVAAERVLFHRESEPPGLAGRGRDLARRWREVATCTRLNLLTSDTMRHNSSELEALES
eukprot:scaffold50049_cov31-Tisochrysis_lutea.AAC.1